MSNIINPQFVKELYSGEHNLLSDEIIVCLMEPAFIYDPAIHLAYSDIMSQEISEGNGYFRIAKILKKILVSIDGENTIITCDSTEWTATGGNLPEFKSVCVINNTHPAKRVLGCVTMNNTYNIIDGSSFVLHFPNGIFNAIPNPV